MRGSLAVLALLCGAASGKGLVKPESQKPMQIDTSGLDDPDEVKEESVKEEVTPCEEVKVKVVSTKYGAQNSLKLDLGTDKPITVFPKNTLSDHASRTFSSVCLSIGSHTAHLHDEYGDGWHGGYLVFSNVETGLVYGKVGEDFTGGREKTYSFHVHSEKKSTANDDDDDDDDEEENMNEEEEEDDDEDNVAAESVKTANKDPWPTAGDTYGIIYKKEAKASPEDGRVTEARILDDKDAKHSDGQRLKKKKKMSEQERREAMHLRHIGLKRKMRRRMKRRTRTTTKAE